MADAPKKARKTLGDLLIEKGIISRAQLWEALRVQSLTGELLGDILIKLDMASKENIDEILGVQKVNLEETSQAEPG